MSERLRSALVAFEDRLRRANAPVATNLRPPASEQALRRLEVETGWAATGEALTWWQWHDGVEDPEPNSPRSLLRLAGLQLGRSSFTPLTLEQGLEKWATRIRFARETAEDAEADGWHFEHSDSWFPVGESEFGSELLIELSVGASGESPVRTWEWADAEGRAQKRAGSIAEMIERWNDAIDRRLWTYTVDRGWERDSAHMTAEDRHTHFL
jgi:hypothetical protein